MNELIRVGYWSDGEQNATSEYPWPQSTRVWPIETTKKIADYLKNGKEHEAWMGCSYCRICNKWDNGSTDLTDGIYVWPEGLAHYIEAHGVTNISPEFIAHVLTSKEIK